MFHRTRSGSRPLAFGALGLAALALALGAPQPSQAAEDKPVMVIDAPDLYRHSGPTNGPRFSELAGQPVYSNTGAEIGVIEDFILVGRGEVAAVIDTDDGPLEDLLQLEDDDLVIVPLRQLRRASPGAFAS